MIYDILREQAVESGGNYAITSIDYLSEVTQKTVQEVRKDLIKLQKEKKIYCQVHRLDKQKRERPFSVKTGGF